MQRNVNVFTFLNYLLKKKVDEQVKTHTKETTTWHTYFVLHKK